MIYFRMRQARKRDWVVVALVVTIAVPALAVMERVRAYSAGASPRQALELTARTPPQDMFLSDISLFDNLAAMEQLVPRSTGYLNGASLVEIPGALVPRALWRHKPQDVDHRVAAYLYPGSDAGVPITFQGELYWNGGLVAVALGGLILGLAIGGAARLGLRAPPGTVSFLLYALAVPFTYALLTRALATMVENLVFAFAGVGAAFLALHPRRPKPEHDRRPGGNTVSTPVLSSGHYNGFRSDRARCHRPQ